MSIPFATLHRLRAQTEVEQLERAGWLSRRLLRAVEQRFLTAADWRALEYARQRNPVHLALRGVHAKSWLESLVDDLIIGAYPIYVQVGYVDLKKHRLPDGSFSMDQWTTWEESSFRLRELFERMAQPGGIFAHIRPYSVIDDADFSYSAKEREDVSRRLRSSLFPQPVDPDDHKWPPAIRSRARDYLAAIDSTETSVTLGLLRSNAAAGVVWRSDLAEEMENVLADLDGISIDNGRVERNDDGSRVVFYPSVVLLEKTVDNSAHAMRLHNDGIAIVEDGGLTAVGWRLAVMPEGSQHCVHIQFESKDKEYETISHYVVAFACNFVRRDTIHTFLVDPSQDPTHIAKLFQHLIMSGIEDHAAALMRFSSPADARDQGDYNTANYAEPLTGDVETYRDVDAFLGAVPSLRGSAIIRGSGAAANHAMLVAGFVDDGVVYAVDINPHAIDGFQRMLALDIDETQWGAWLPILSQLDPHRFSSAWQTLQQKARLIAGDADVAPEEMKAAIAASFYFECSRYWTRASQLRSQRAGVLMVKEGGAFVSLNMNNSFEWPDGRGGIHAASGVSPEEEQEIARNIGLLHPRVRVMRDVEGLRPDHKLVVMTGVVPANVPRFLQGGTVR